MSFESESATDLSERARRVCADARALAQEGRDALVMAKAYVNAARRRIETSQPRHSHAPRPPRQPGLPYRKREPDRSLTAALARAWNSYR
jgi:hypothetical protein